MRHIDDILRDVAPLISEELFAELLDALDEQDNDTFNAGRELGKSEGGGCGYVRGRFG
jgi:hypothetical protein